MSLTPDQQPPAPPWGPMATVAWTLTAMLLGLVVATVFYGMWAGDQPRPSDSYDGVLIALGTFVSVPVQLGVVILAVIFVVGEQHGTPLLIGQLSETVFEAVQALAGIGSVRRTGLEIDRLGARHALIIQRQVLAPGTQKIQGPIPGDGHQPGQRRALFRGIRLRPVPDFEVAVLQGFLRPVTLPQHTDQHAEQMRRRQLVQPTKGDDIALRRCRE